MFSTFIFYHDVMSLMTLVILFAMKPTLCGMTTATSDFSNYYVNYCVHVPRFPRAAGAKYHKVNVIKQQQFTS